MLKNIYKMSPIHRLGREVKFADLWMGTNYGALKMQYPAHFFLRYFIPKIRI